MVPVPSCPDSYLSQAVTNRQIVKTDIIFFIGVKIFNLNFGL